MNVAAHRTDSAIATFAVLLLAAIRSGVGSIGVRIEAARRRSRDRAALARMSIRQLDDLPIEWPEDVRHIRRF